jgi:hypothetical protein
MGRMSVGPGSPDFGFSTSAKGCFPRLFYGPIFLTDSPRQRHPKSCLIQGIFLLFFNDLSAIRQAARLAAKWPQNAAVSRAHSTGRNRFGGRLNFRFL